MATNYGLEGVKKLEDEELDLAVAEALGWPVIQSPRNPDEYYYEAEDGSVIWTNTWHPSTKARQFLKLMLDYRVGVIYSKPKKRWKAIGYVDQSHEAVDQDAIFTFGISPSEAVCRCIILLKEAGAKCFYQKIQESLQDED